MSVRTGAHRLLDALAEQGTRYLFGIPGVHTLPLYDALADCPDIRPVVTRHEAGAAFAADGYARLSGRPGVVSVVPGPGALNAATAVLCAWSDRVPMIVLTPMLDASGREGAVHEGDLGAAYRPFTKAQLRIDRSADAAPSIRRACEVATRAPAGPVQVQFSLRVLKEHATEAAAQGPTHIAEDVDRTAIRAAEFLQGCRSPVLMLGMGVARAHEAALAVVERLGCPSFTDVGCRGLVPEDHPLAGGLLTWTRAREVLAAADGMLVLGSRLSEISTFGWDVRLPPRLARIDADPAQLQGNYPATLAVQADPAAVLRRLADLFAGERSRAPNEAARVLARARRAGRFPCDESGEAGIHPRAAVRELRAALPRETVVTTDGTATEFWLSEESFPVLAPGGFILPEIQQSMGYALAAAIGARIATDEAGADRSVVCITGDGSLQMMLGELATAAGLRRRLTIVIFEDGYYNALRIYQDGLYGRQVGVTLRNPDFVALTQAYGAHAERVQCVEDLRSALERSLAHHGLSLVTIAIDPAPVPNRYARRLEQMAQGPARKE
jgi:thiamine pyrophosphate-dependent acetolactate synthase large subunit-like protein